MSILSIEKNSIASLALNCVKNTYAQMSRIDLQLTLEVYHVCIFNPVIRIFIREKGGSAHVMSADTHQGGLFYPWLPKGLYSFEFSWPVSLPQGQYELCVAWGTVDDIKAPDHVALFAIVDGAADVTPLLGTWKLCAATEKAINSLSWQRGMDNWFHRHFCHAAVVIAETFLDKSPLLRGRILDIGAGDGITDLGLFLRYQPEELVAMDIVDYTAELPRVAQDNNLPLEALPDGLTFIHKSCESIPYDDESFDLIISWGSVEHIKGGYEKTLDEVWRVLKPGGIFFVNPGLYYSEFGSHLGEFSDISHLHLKISEPELKNLVMNTAPKAMDRSGFDATNGDYWRFYKELNRIRVFSFEREIKKYGYEIIRAAVRANDLVNYTPELQKYSIIDLAIEDVFFTLSKPEVL